MSAHLTITPRHDVRIFLLLATAVPHNRDTNVKDIRTAYHIFWPFIMESFVEDSRYINLCLDNHGFPRTLCSNPYEDDF